MTTSNCLNQTTKTAECLVDGRGRCLNATEFIAEGTVILQEFPLVSAQFEWNRHCGYAACDHCMRPLETASQNCERLLQARGNTVELSWPEIDVPRQQQAAIELAISCIRCEHCSLAQYCSLQCKTDAFCSYHSLLCEGLLPASDAALLRELQEIWRQTHYPPETTSLMLILRMMALIKLKATSACNGAGKEKETLQKFAKFCNSTETFDSISCEMLNHRIVGQEYKARIELIAKHLSKMTWLHTSSTEQWLLPNNLLQVFVMIGRNGQGIGTSALSEWVAEVDGQVELVEPKSSAACVAAGKDSRFSDFVDDLYSKLEEEVGIEYLNNEGSGLFELQSACNHSCSANAEVKFLENNFLLSLVATRNINSGQEITINYLPDHLVHKRCAARREFLLNYYLFNCRCEKCDMQISGLVDDVSSVSSVAESELSDIEMND